MDNRTQLQRIKKADLALADLTTDTGLMPEWHASEFVKLLMIPSVFMGLADMRAMNSHTEKWPRMGMTNRVLHPLGERQSVPYGQRSTVETEFYSLSTVEFKGEVQIPDEVYEDNIERKEVAKTILELMANRTRFDMEDILVNGDTASADPVLATMDGLIKLTTSNLVPVSPSAILTPADLKDAIKVFPQAYYSQKKSRLKFLTAPHVNLEYGHSFGTRETMMGDAALTGVLQNSYSGIAIQEIPHFPTTLGGSNNESVVILCDPKDFKIGLWRNLRLETDRDVRAGVDTWVVSTRFGCTWEYELATAKITGVIAE